MPISKLRSELELSCISYAMRGRQFSAWCFTMTSHWIRLDWLKSNGSELLSGVQEKVTQTVEDAKTNIGEMAENLERKSETPISKPTKGPNPRKSEEILTLIEKLASMKEAGILTEEEFSEKKKQLLEEL